MGFAKRLMMELQEQGNWPVFEKNEKYVCCNHFHDEYLNNRIKKNRSLGICSYCGKKDYVYDMHDFCVDIVWKVALYYTDISNADLNLANSFYDDENEVIPGYKRVCDYIVPIENTVYESKQNLLYALHLYTDNQKLNEDIESVFATDVWISRDFYEEDRNIRLSNQWNRFVYSVTHQRRFTFLATPEFIQMVSDSSESSNDILSSISKIIINQNLCQELLPGTVLYRARKIDNPSSNYQFDDITSPPDHLAIQNRMSPAGVSMFYASFDKDTAMNECAGDDNHSIIVGNFKTTKTLRVIDLSNIPDNSFWMDGWQENMFLHSFNSEITKRLDPDDKNLIQYIPTRVFTEFLRYMFKDANGCFIDGLIYGSSKTQERNIVLFCNQKDSRRYVDENVKIDVYVRKSIWKQLK